MFFFSVKLQIRIILFLLMVGKPWISIGAPDVEDGMGLFMKGDYTSALTSFKNMEDQGVVNTSLFEHMGYCYYKTGSIAMAVLYYEKALKLTPLNGALKENIHQLQEKLDIQYDERMPWLMMILNASGIFLPNTWAWLGLLSAVLLIAFIVNKYPWKSWSRREKFIFYGMVISFLVTTLLAYYRYLQVYKNEGIIVTTSTALYEAPDLISPTIDTLPLGTKIYYDETLGNFYKVKTSNNLIGWVSISKVNRI
ncbi:MAG: SH3 domain-containing protein [Lewinellaceae bacterium]|nr:SH3 domain-containing protein [Lewinellaceae bacterium]